MTTEEIIIANLKCSGCATTIKNELSKIEGIKNVDVLNEKNAVKVWYENVARETIVKRLHELGYPEATEEKGLLLQLKSYASCVVGRINNL